MLQPLASIYKQASLAVMKLPVNCLQHEPSGRRRKTWQNSVPYRDVTRLPVALFCHGCGAGL